MSICIHDPVEKIITKKNSPVIDANITVFRSKIKKLMKPKIAPIRKMTLKNLIIVSFIPTSRQIERDFTALIIS